MKVGGCAYWDKIVKTMKIKVFHLITTNESKGFGEKVREDGGRGGGDILTRTL